MGREEGREWESLRAMRRVTPNKGDREERKTEWKNVKLPCIYF